MEARGLKVVDFINKQFGDISELLAVVLSFGYSTAPVKHFLSQK